jgi:16S rRNA (guanine527-N7)-methyltransferase
MPEARHHPRSRPPELAADRARALALTPVSRETLARLDALATALLVWSERINLIAKSTIPQLWTRHIADSLQLLDLAPDSRIWIDLGSGAGFPGLVVACALADRPGATVHLIESNTRKAAFLREAARATGAPAEVHAVRIEKFVESFAGNADIITARALAPLKLLLDISAPLLRAGAVGLFPKGQDVEAELTEATKYWDMVATLVPSRTDTRGQIVVVRELAERARAGSGTD